MGELERGGVWSLGNDIQCGHGKDERGEIMIGGMGFRDDGWAGDVVGAGDGFEGSDVTREGCLTFIIL